MPPISRRTALAALAGTAAGLAPRRASAVPPAADLTAVLDKAVKFLTTRQGDDGSFAPKLAGPGLTALTVSGLLRAGTPADNPVVAKGLKYLESNVKPDGGVYARGLANYTTCLAIVAFQEANADKRYDKVIAAATKFVKGIQYGEGTGTAAADVKYGGVGYDAKSRPDLSNTQFMVEALLAAGVPKDDPAVKRAVAFVSRSQNLPGEFNDQPFAAKTTADDKGGFVYNPTDAGNPTSDKVTPAGGLRTEGGMTYAGLKTFLYAGISKDDPRVVAAVAWVRKHYTLAENPGQGQAGLYYYYHTFAKAMTAVGEDAFKDDKGGTHDWRQELFDELKKRQQADGSWANPNNAFLENVPELATAFAVLSLSYCRPKA